MKNPLILTFDCGTQSSRALLVDKKGNIVAKVQQKFEPYYSSKPGYAEQKPEVYLNALKYCGKEIIKQNKNLVKDIIGVTSTTIRDTWTIVDKDFKPLRDFIVWLDQREAECKKPLPAKSKLAFTLVGMLEALEDQRKISHCNWIYENEKDLMDKAYKFIGYSTYVSHYLTGEEKDSSASQVGHVPFDYKNKCWKKENDIQYPVFYVPHDKLIDLVDPGEIIGYITKQVEKDTGIPAGLPVIATGADKECETLGLGVYNNDMAALSFGTAATVQMSFDSFVTPENLLPAYPGAVKEVYNPEVQVYRGYWMVTWFKNEFAHREAEIAKKEHISPEEVLNRVLKVVPPGSEGLMLQPYWSPLLKLPEAKGCMIGFNSDHTRAHIYKAIIEGIGYGLLDGLRGLEKRSGVKATSIAVAGGGSQSDEILQITADMFGVPVKRIQTFEACGVGSSMVAFIALKEFKDTSDAIKHMVHYQKDFKPDMKVHQIYDDLYNEIYVNIYDSLKPLYKKLRGINNRHKLVKGVN